MQHVMDYVVEQEITERPTEKQLSAAIGFMDQEFNEAMDKYDRERNIERIHPVYAVCDRCKKPVFQNLTFVPTSQAISDRHVTSVAWLCPDCLPAADARPRDFNEPKMR